MTSPVSRVLVRTRRPHCRLRLPISHDAGVAAFEGGPHSLLRPQLQVLRVDFQEQGHDQDPLHDPTGPGGPPPLLLPPFPTHSACHQEGDQAPQDS